MSLPDRRNGSDCGHFAGASQAPAQHTCKPTMAFTEAHYSPMKLPKLERTWTVASPSMRRIWRRTPGSFNPIHVVEGKRA